jgi:hypothetical protein
VVPGSQERNPTWVPGSQEKNPTRVPGSRKRNPLRVPGFQERNWELTPLTTMSKNYEKFTYTDTLSASEVFIFHTTNVIFVGVDRLHQELQNNGDL